VAEVKSFKCWCGSVIICCEKSNDFPSCKVLGYHNIVVEYSRHLGYYVMSTGTPSLLGLLETEDESTFILRNLSNYLPLEARNITWRYGLNPASSRKNCITSGIALKLWDSKTEVCITESVNSEEIFSYDKVEWIWKDVAMNLLKVGVLASQNSPGQNSGMHLENYFQNPILTAVIFLSVYEIVSLSVIKHAKLACFLTRS
jgi:hypothetical protein